MRKKSRIWIVIVVGCICLLISIKVVMNIYWPVFKNLEFEFTKLMYDIHIDDEQLTVYSSKISDLILRSSIEIESISKELYYNNGGPKTGQIKYDDDALAFLIKIWSLDKKVVLISSASCYQKDKTLTPFVKNETRTDKTSMTFSWNNSYQNLKHNRAKSLKYGNVKYLFDCLSALYVLNLYYSDKTISLENDTIGTTISPNIGSDIFSVVIAPYHGSDGKGSNIKVAGFEKSIYYVDLTEISSKIFNESRDAFNSKIVELAFQNPKTHDYLDKTDDSNLKPNWLIEALGKEDYINTFRQAHIHSPLSYKNMKYEAKLNKNKFEI